MAVIGDKPLELHAHCTIGLAEPGLYRRAGLRRRAPCSAPRARRRTARRTRRRSASSPTCAALGHTVDIDEEARRRSRPLLHRAGGGGGPARRQAPGLRRRLSAATSCPAAWSAPCAATSASSACRIWKAQVIEEIGRVREELGWPIVMTPFAQMVHDPGGDERHRQGALRGDPRRGDPLCPRPLRPAQRADRRPCDGPHHVRAARPGAAPPSRAWPTLPELRRRLGAHLSDEEFLLRATMPAGQVDAMQPPGPRRATTIRRRARP